MISPASQADEAAPMKVVRVKALQPGTIIVDGKPTTLADLVARLAELRASNGAVFYYREGAETTEGQFEVFRAIVEARVPISLSSKADFSDYIDQYGQSQPRQTDPA
jgi:hypothetical protein